MEEEQPLLEKGQDGLFPPPYGQLSSPPKKFSGAGMGVGDHIVAIFLPWLMFTLVVWVFIYFYWEHRWAAWSLVAACLLLGSLIVAMGAGRARSVRLAVGLLCLAATCVGASVGVYLYDRYASTYWQLQDGAEYKHLSPSSKGSDYADASLLSFTPDAFVDTLRTLGYMEAGVVYCVAPVSTQKFTSAPQYWAAGKDCCDQRGNFRCGDAGNVQAKMGVLIQNESDEQKYKTAIRMAEAVYNLSPTETGHYALMWTASEDSSTYKTDLWASCLHLFCMSSAMYFVCSVVAAMMLRKSVESAF